MKPDMVADMHHVLRTIGMDWLFRIHGVPVHSIRKRDVRGMATWRRYDRVFDQCGLKGGAVVDGCWSVKPADGHQRVVGVAPFAQHKGKIWPLEKMERLVRMLSEKGYRVVLFGSPLEASVLESWAEKYEGVESLAGRFGFEEELKRIAALDVMVSMDSANMHFASCMGVPVVSIWGATHPCRGFYGWKQDPAWAVQKEMDCRPCSKYGKKPCQKGDYPCLNGIEPIEVLERIDVVLSGES
jgi:ADP-heptose:LPS heptosyltransferase